MVTRCRQTPWRADVQPLFRFEGVGVALDGTRVLDDVTGDIHDGGVTAVVGSSGAGKTTLLRLCNRLEVPTSGRVLHFGQDLAELDVLQLRRRVGMVFQQPTLFGGTVADNLAVAAPDTSPTERRRALDQVALDAGLLDRRADTLSGGEAQRVCLARTLLTRPTALLLDEPTTGLDAAPKLAFERTASALAEHGIPIVWVSHELDQVRRIADHALVLDHGRLVAALDDVTRLARQPGLGRVIEGGTDDAWR